MEFKDINTFLRNHTGEKWFNSDFELYKKIFPASKLISELEKAQKYNKSDLDERMCNELMSQGAVCDCSIWENRGYTKDKNGFIIPLNQESPASNFEKKLLETDLDGKPKYNALKELIFGLGIHTNDNKGKTYVTALKEKKAKLEADAKAREEEVAEQKGKEESQQTKSSDTEEVMPPTDSEKKSEDHEQNTQE